MYIIYIHVYISKHLRADILDEAFLRGLAPLQTMRGSTETIWSTASVLQQTKNE